MIQRSPPFQRPLLPISVAVRQLLMLLPVRSPSWIVAPAPSFWATASGLPTIPDPREGRTASLRKASITQPAGGRLPGRRDAHAAGRAGNLQAAFGDASHPMLPGLAEPQEGVERGWFRVAPDGPPNFSTILASAAELAAGMAYLHSQGMVHGDLSSGAARPCMHASQRSAEPCLRLHVHDPGLRCSSIVQCVFSLGCFGATQSDTSPIGRGCVPASAGNVLLMSSPASAHGFSLKVTDFGLARQMDLNSRIQTQTSGTVGYMAVEVRPCPCMCRHELPCAAVSARPSRPRVACWHARAVAPLSVLRGCQLRGRQLVRRVRVLLCAAGAQRGHRQQGEHAPHTT